MEQKKGKFVISIDTELAWGSFARGLNDRLIEEFIGTRYCIERLLALLEKYHLAATFAMVGHLMLDKCDKQDGIKHKNIIRLDFSWYKKDWFDQDPAADIDRHPIWYGTDILEKIVSAKPKHEIACHSFCHMIFGDPGCSAESAESDIRECIDTAKLHNIELKTFIFPRNSEGHKPLLRKYGFKAYRGSGNEWFDSIKHRRLRQLCHLLDNFFGIAPRTSVLYKDEHGLYNTTGNMLYLSCTGIRRLIPISSRVCKAKKGIDLAIKKGEIFHIWFHPYNLASDPDTLLNGLDKVFEYARAKMDQGLLDNCTIIDMCNQHEAIVTNCNLQGGTHVDSVYS